MRLRGAFGVALVLAIIGPAPAEAALKWSAPATISPNGFAAQILMDARGDSLVVWGEHAGQNFAGDAKYRWRPSRGDWTATQTLDRDIANGTAPSVLTPRGEAGIAWEDHAHRVLVATAHFGERFGAPIVASAPGERLETPGTPVIASDDQGDAVVAWNDADGTVRAATGSLGGRFDQPRALGTDSAGAAPYVAVNPAGAAAVSWGLHSGVAKLSYRPAAGEFGPSETAPVNGPTPVPLVALDPLGDAVVASTGFAPNAEGSNGTSFAVRSPLGGWGPKTMLDPGGNLAQVFAQPDGSVSFLVEAGSSGYDRTVRFTTRKPEGAVIGPTDISSPDACGPRAAINLRGDILATWARGCTSTGAGTRVFVENRPAGGVFGPESPVADTDAIDPVPALDDAGDAALLWNHHGELQVSIREDSRPLPLPPAVTVQLPPSLPVGNGGQIQIPVLCSQACTVHARGIVYGAAANGIAAAQGRGVRLKRRHRRKVSYALGPSATTAARSAVAAGRHPWLSLSVSAKGRSPRPISVSRHTRLR